MRLLYLIGLAYVAVSTYALKRGPVLIEGPDDEYYEYGDPNQGAASWYRQIKPYCNTLEIETALRKRPPPESLGGVGFSAACYDLAGRINEARQRILTLDEERYWKAAGIVFAVGHPIADMGDDKSAGPIMELVIEFWPNHYQALYHAGAARFTLGDDELAEQHLRQFLEYYDEKDGWVMAARSMLKKLEAR